MNKIYKVIWNEARNAYVVVSEIAKNHGSKSSSTKKLLAMLIATGVMTCASFNVLAAQPFAAPTNESQYVAFKDDSTSLDGGQVKNFGSYKYIYDATNKYWVREGYVLTVNKNGGKYTPLSDNAIRANVSYTGTSVPEGILQSVTSTVAHNGVVTHSGDSLQKITAGSYAGVSHGGGPEVAGSWNYIINDSSWKDSVDGYVDLKGDPMPKGFKTIGSELKWDEAKQTYTYQGKAVDYRNMYVIDGKLGVFTNFDGSEVYTGTVYGKYNEILMTVKDNGKFYSYWAASVTDPSATMETYPVSKYNSDLAVIDKNIKDLNKDIIKEVTLTKDTNSAIIGLVRNGGKAVDGAITVTSGGGTGGSGAAYDTFVKISNAADKEGKTFATGSKVEAIVDNGATTGIKINGQDYTIKSGSVVSVAQNADKKTTTITVDGTETTITDTDTTYTKGDGIEISDANAISVSKNLTGMQSIKGAGGTINLADSAITVNETTFNKDGRIQNVAEGTETKDAVNFGQLQATNKKVDNLTTEVGKGWTVATENGTATKVGAGDTVKFIGDDNIKVSNTGKDKDVKVELKKNLTGLTSVTTNNAYVTNVDASKNESVTNVEYVKNQIADAALSAGNGISITDKKINVKLKNDEQNLVVNEDGLFMNTTLKGIQSITGAGTGAGSISFEGSNVKVNDKVTIDQDGKISGVAEGEISRKSTDAINGSQLHHTNENVAALDKRVTQNEADIAQNKADIAQNKADIAQNKADIAQNKADIAQNKADIAQNKADIAQNKADIAQNKADIDQNKTDIKNLDTRVTNVEKLAKKHTTVTQGDNITVTEDTNKDGGKEYNVALDKAINLDSVTTGQTVMNTDGLKVGKDVSVTETAVTAGKTSISDEGVKVGDKTYISDKGLNANDQTVTNVKAGELSATSKDAVNGSQLYKTNQEVANNTNRISNLDNRVNKVGAGAAALAALHPLDFDPDAKWDFAAGYGNYRGANAAAVGAYYRPNEDTMFSVGGTFGNGENMVNAGVSFKLGSGSSHVSTSRVAMAKEIKELRGELEAMKSAMLDANAGKKIDTSKLQLFPDVPQNHWAYEYVAQLAGNGMIEGYPDGNFAGDRPMTRYEFAAILYRAMTKGAVLSDKILSEFSHELEYFTVDTIAKDKAGNPTIQRVRTVKENINK
ncbi:ESPR-type extended signal peptide-containing protein [Megasphaera elsdenii]|uniref:ESPR-type extended signal peptide-containing protein n=1 Tax=Megasphaera elsdenii TaxID=907 RepID=UPI000A518F8F|nr:ESPR-type extended signal peptide-containing protein [Megasphaera elsdenii]